MARRSVFALVLLAACSGSAHEPLIVADPPNAGPTSPTGTAQSPATAAGSGGSLAGATGSGQPDAGSPSAPTPSRTSGLPCELGQLLADRCQACHGRPPVGAPVSFVTRADLLAMSRLDPAQHEIDLMLTRAQKGEMPPAPMAKLSAAELAIMSDWIAAGTPEQACGTMPLPDDAGMPTTMAPNPFDTPTVCTSGDYYHGDGDGSPQMHPGNACISCHSRGEGPRFAIGGTVYPTAHEPNDCDGADDSHIRVIITGADGKELELKVNGAGNFYSPGPVALPFHARVAFDGRERRMSAAQMTGDCNGCHTEQGVNGAPGRIMVP